LIRCELWRREAGGGGESGPVLGLSKMRHPKSGSIYAWMLFVLEFGF